MPHLTHTDQLPQGTRIFKEAAKPPIPSISRQKPCEQKKPTLFILSSIQRQTPRIASTALAIHSSIFRTSSHSKIRWQGSMCTVLQEVYHFTCGCRSRAPYTDVQPCPRGRRCREPPGYVEIRVNIDRDCAHCASRG